ncbi:preprotein translocase subunit YajC [Microbacterium resistens]|uniref:Preprotein translocase subunit YajC n=1 Tax=Microbacterium resistens TaxID=156977 RepID=A0ABU1SHT7_9MICO|nr:preprotein translocase subunit YajC [Microbacterium resistens]MDR6868568.1 preprotein translocase subunit YajC [Microbacterium resistens]
MDFGTFISQYGLFFVLAILLVFMIFSTRRRTQRMKQEQEDKAKQTVPGARVLLQGGLYGTIVEFDPENLDQPAQVEIAPGVVIEVHSQAILRIVTDEPTPSVDETHVPLDESHTPLDERELSSPAVTSPAATETPAPKDATSDAKIESAEETRARLERDADGNK